MKKKHFFNQLSVSYRTTYAISFEHEVTFQRTVRLVLAAASDVVRPMEVATLGTRDKSAR